MTEKQATQYRMNNAEIRWEIIKEDGQVFRTRTLPFDYAPDFAKRVLKLKFTKYDGQYFTRAYKLEGIRVVEIVAEVRHDGNSMQGDRITYLSLN